MAYKCYQHFSSSTSVFWWGHISNSIPATTPSSKRGYWSSGAETQRGVGTPDQKKQATFSSPTGKNQKRWYARVSLNDNFLVAVF